MSATPNKLIFTISRMNPPTPGHMEVVRALLEEAMRSNENTVYILLSKKVDKKNPMQCETITPDDETNKLPVLNHLVEALRERMLDHIDDKDKRAKLRDIYIEITCVKPNEISPFSRLKTIIQDIGMTHGQLFLVIGEDRADMSTDIESVLNKNRDDSPFTVESHVLRRTGMSSLKDLSEHDYAGLNINTVKPGEMSGSFVRNLVQYKQEGKFIELYKLYAPNMPENIIKKLYTTIERNLPKPKPSTTAIKLKTESEGRASKRQKAGSSKTKRNYKRIKRR